MSAPPTPWLPVRASLRNDALYLQARQVPTEALIDPFMQDTVARVSGPETVLQIARADLGRTGPGCAPAGLIFHVARCGSTLVSQLLKQCPGVAVYSEPLPINEILLPPHPWPRHEMVLALRSLGPVLAQHARGPYVIKFSSWNTLYCDLLAEAFPDSPWVLCLRDPLEVAVSLLREPPAWLRAQEPAAARLAPVVDPLSQGLTREAFLATLFGQFCTAALTLDSRRGRLVSHETLPAAVWQTIAPHFSIPVDLALQQRLVAAAQRDAKSPLQETRAYAPDSLAKQAAATDALRAAVDALARPALKRLTDRF